MGATLVSGVDAAPVFEASEHVFDSVALFVDEASWGIDLPVGFRRNAEET